MSLQPLPLQRTTARKRATAADDSSCDAASEHNAPPRARKTPAVGFIPRLKEDLIVVRFDEETVEVIDHDHVEESDRNHMENWNCKTSSGGVGGRGAPHNSTEQVETDYLTSFGELVSTTVAHTYEGMKTLFFGGAHLQGRRSRSADDDATAIAARRRSQATAHGLGGGSPPPFLSLGGGGRATATGGPNMRNGVGILKNASRPLARARDTFALRGQFRHPAESADEHQTLHHNIATDGGRRLPRRPQQHDLPFQGGPPPPLHPAVGEDAAGNAAAVARRPAPTRPPPPLRARIQHLLSATLPITDPGNTTRLPFGQTQTALQYVFFHLVPHCRPPPSWYKESYENFRSAVRGRAAVTREVTTGAGISLENLADIAEQFVSHIVKRDAERPVVDVACERALAVVDNSHRGLDFGSFQKAYGMVLELADVEERAVPAPSHGVFLEGLGTPTDNWDNKINLLGHRAFRKLMKAVVGRRRAEHASQEKRSENPPYNRGEELQLVPPALFRDEVVLSAREDLVPEERNQLVPPIRAIPCETEHGIPCGPLSPVLERSEYPHSFEQGSSPARDQTVGCRSRTSSSDSRRSDRLSVEEVLQEMSPKKAEFVQSPPRGAPPPGGGGLLRPPPRETVSDRTTTRTSSCGTGGGPRRASRSPRGDQQPPPVRRASSARPTIRRQSLAVCINSEIVIPRFEQRSVSNDYQFLEKKGKGAFGAVFKVNHKRTGVFRACKSLKISSTQDRGLIETEIEVMKSLDHINVARLHECYVIGEGGGGGLVAGRDSSSRASSLRRSSARPPAETNVYLIMELCEGGTLLDKIVHGRPVPENLASLYLKQLLSALSYCHGRGLTHRDIKPDNVLFSENCLKVIDFGLSDFLRKTVGGVLPRCGTPHYMAPEMYRGEVYDQQVQSVRRIF